jgi:hypothetical protein
MATYMKLLNSMLSVATVLAEERMQHGRCEFALRRCMTASDVMLALTLVLIRGRDIDIAGAHSLSNNYGDASSLSAL